MAHRKTGGSKMSQGANTRGKSLGLKVSEGQVVKRGEILVKQRGLKFLPGINVKIGRDYTIFAIKQGKVHFRNVSGKKRGRKKIDVIEC